MEKYDFQVHALPDIEMYAGDTVPWEIILMRDDGSYFSTDTASECICMMTLTPYKVTSGIGVNAVIATPVLTKTGRVETTLDGVAAVVFDFTPADTRSLRGKFLYQIEVTHDTDLRICQGHLFIKQNINR